MSPEQLAAAELLRLARDIEAEVEVIETLAREVAEVVARPLPLGAEAQAYLAMKLHGWYTGLEALLERVARLLEGSVPDGPSSRQDLLRDMTLSLPGIRPAVIDRSRLADLTELLSFRHFFRHAYAVPLDEEAMRRHAQRLGQVHQGVVADLTSFAGVMRKMAVET